MRQEKSRSPAARPAPPPELDPAIVERARQGDESASRAIVVRYQRPVFALLARMLASSARQALVEDLAQETFLRVFKALPGFEPRGAARLSTWILTIATRLAIDELRRRRAVHEPLDERVIAMPGASRADSPAERRALGKAIETAVAGLSPDHRAVFVLRAWHGLSYREIAEALSCDIGTVKSRLSRAKTQLRDVLEEVRNG